MIIRSHGTPMLESPESSRIVPEPPPLVRPGGGLLGRGMFQRITWLRPSAEEKRLWLVEGAVILGAVTLLGTLMFLIFR